MRRSQANKMNARKLAIIFTPNLYRSSSMDPMKQMLLSQSGSGTKPRTPHLSHKQ